MRRRIWLSYDLGLNGNYAGLYQFLDNIQAVEIGNSAASFMYETRAQNDEELIDILKNELIEHIGNTKNARIYIIRAEKEDGNIIGVKGSFLLGKRKSNPWKGYGDVGDTEDEED